jgi:hypothetical protein
MMMTAAAFLVSAIVLTACTADEAAPPQRIVATQPASRPASQPVIKTWEEMKPVRVPLPSEFASIFSFGYLNDIMPKTEEDFEKLLVTIKEGGFNVVHCAYTDWRLELCRKHGVKMMIDLLAPPYRFFTNPDGVQALCIKLRNDEAVWGYNLWNDKFGSRGEHGPGLNQRVVRIRTWDPTHPTFVGTYLHIGMGAVTDADAIGYYDYHWTRGRQKHFPYLMQYHHWAVQRRAIFCRWVAVKTAKSAEEIYRRDLFTINTSIACGLKGALWFLGQDMLAAKAMGWSPAGQAVCRVNREVMPLKALIMKIGNPVDVYSTLIPIKTDDKPDPVNKLHGFPKDFWLQPAGGHFLLGIFKDAEKRDYAFIANHDHTAAHDVTLAASKPVKVEMFDRKGSQWRPIEVKDGKFSLRLEISAGELLRFE